MKAKNTQAGVEISTLSVIAWAAKVTNTNRITTRSNAGNRLVWEIAHSTNSTINRERPTYPPSTWIRRYSLCAAQVWRSVDDRTVVRNDEVAGTEAPAEPGGFRRGCLEHRPQQLAAAQIVGLAVQHLEQAERTVAFAEHQEHGDGDEPGRDQHQPMGAWHGGAGRQATGCRR